MKPHSLLFWVAELDESVLEQLDTKNFVEAKKGKHLDVVFYHGLFRQSVQIVQGIQVLFRLGNQSGDGSVTGEVDIFRVERCEKLVGFYLIDPVEPQSLGLVFAEQPGNEVEGNVVELLLSLPAVSLLRWSKWLRS